MYLRSPSRAGSTVSAILLAMLLASTCASRRIQPPGDRTATDLTAFNATRAFEHVKKLVAIGPRASGSAGNKQTQAYIINELKSYGLKITEDPFEGDSPVGAIPMKNIIGELPGKKPQIVIIASHYDTKRMANFVGANDGGSSTGALLELARVLSGNSPEYTLWFVFFDGEEAVVDWNENGGLDNTYGSRHLASKLVANGSIKKVKAMILLDMIGDLDLGIEKDGYSTSWLVDLIWSTAAQTGHSKHFLSDRSAYQDDHIPFIRARVPAVDLIDFNFGPDNQHWHTTHDTIDKLSPDSLKAVGDIVILCLPRLFKHLSGQSPNVRAR